MPLFRNLYNFISHKIAFIWLLPLIMVLALSCIVIIFQLEFLAEKDEEFTRAKIEILRASGKSEEAKLIERQNSIPEFVFELGLELFKTIFLGLTVAWFADLYMKQLEGDSIKNKFEKSRITEIYPSRLDASKRFVELVQNRKTRKIDILGISLREFLTEQGQMRHVWNAIVARLNEEQKADLPPERRLSVRLLMLDPRSGEGYFRYKIEKPDAVYFHSDIEEGLRQIERTKSKIYLEKY